MYRVADETDASFFVRKSYGLVDLSAVNIKAIFVSLQDSYSIMMALPDSIVENNL